jgi:hypothetical protein
MPTPAEFLMPLQSAQPLQAAQSNWENRGASADYTWGLRKTWDKHAYESHGFYRWTRAGFEGESSWSPPAEPVAFLANSHAVRDSTSGREVCLSGKESQSCRTPRVDMFGVAIPM